VAQEGKKGGNCVFVGGKKKKRKKQYVLRHYQLPKKERKSKGTSRDFLGGDLSFHLVEGGEHIKKEKTKYFQTVREGEERGENATLCLT